ncbi:hypothetical protein HPB48_015908 [Haemaphysalis longicornis]|uniref:Uncharacterized protein n=1 Tax=Haemaphysalis longicornis TaxID=44386 RepID=A0A9J6GEA2_HAELO|nr:hypothetical protein HPB48_015908 [Haemaphysalis longicornis]
MAAPEDCEELEVGLSHPTIPPVLGVRRMGTSESVIISFGVSWVPSKDPQRKSRQDQSRDRGRSKCRKRSESRNRSVSFPPPPSLRNETPNNTTNLYSASVDARETPKHSTPKVGWGSVVTQDANAVITNELQEQNRSQKELIRELREQLKAMQKQREEIKSARNRGQ